MKVVVVVEGPPGYSASERPFTLSPPICKHDTAYCRDRTIWPFFGPCVPCPLDAMTLQQGEHCEKCLKHPKSLRHVDGQRCDGCLPGEGQLLKCVACKLVRYCVRLLFIRSISARSYIRSRSDSGVPESSLERT
jgi:hypothetical protein